MPTPKLPFSREEFATRIARNPHSHATEGNRADDTFPN